MPSPSRQPCTAELGTGVRDKFQSSLWKKIAAKPAETTPFSDTNKTTCGYDVKLGTDTATAMISKGSGAAISDALEDKTKSTAKTKPVERHGGSHSQVAASKRLQAQARPENVGFTTPAHSYDARVITQTHLYKAASDDKERIHQNTTTVNPSTKSLALVQTLMLLIEEAKRTESQVLD